MGYALTTLNDPTKHAHIFPKPWPSEPPVRIFTEPVNLKNVGSMLNKLAHLQPMLEIISNVVTTKRNHREWVSTDNTYLANNGSSRLRSHRGGLIDSILPIEGLNNQGRRVSTTAAEQKRRNRNSVGIIPLRIKRRALR